MSNDGAVAAMQLFVPLAWFAAQVSFGWWAMKVALRKGHNQWLGFLLGFVLMPVGVLLCHLLKPKSAAVAAQEDTPSVKFTVRFSADESPETANAAPEPSGTTSARTRRAYLILLYDRDPWTESEKRELIEAIRREQGAPVELLDEIHVEGEFPTGPDTYVVMLAMLKCKAVGIPFDNERDSIAFRGGIHPSGAGVGLITITVG